MNNNVWIISYLPDNIILSVHNGLKMRYRNVFKGRDVSVLFFYDFIESLAIIICHNSFHYSNANSHVRPLLFFLHLFGPDYIEASWPDSELAR